MKEQDRLIRLAEECQIGPYTAGITRVTVPYSQLTDIFKKEFLPADRSSMKAGGNIELMSKSDLMSDKSYVANGEMEVYGDMEASLYAVVNIGDLLYDVSIVDETDYRAQTLYYTNQMDVNDVVWLSEYATS